MLQAQNISKRLIYNNKKRWRACKILKLTEKTNKKYTSLDLKDHLRQKMLKVNVVTNSWPNFTKKWQKIKNFKNQTIKELLRKARRGLVAHACNPNTLEAKAAGSQGQEFETSLANMVKPYLY